MDYREPNRVLEPLEEEIAVGFWSRWRRRSPLSTAP